MPGPELCQGKALHEAIRALAEHHVAEENRHISGFEYDLLMRAAAEIERCRDEPPEPDTA